MKFRRYDIFANYGMKVLAKVITGQNNFQHPNPSDNTYKVTATGQNTFANFFMNC